MKKTILIALISPFLFFDSYGQVDIDKSINLSGTGSDAKITGIKDVSAPGDAVSAEALQSGKLVYANAVSGANDITLTFSPVPFTATTLVAGTMVGFKAALPNTGNVRLNVDGQGLTPLFKDVSANLAPGNIQTGQIVTALYDGANFHLLSRIADANSGGTVTSIATTAPITGGTISTTGTIGLTQTGDVLQGSGISVTGGADKLPGTADITIANTGVLSVGASDVVTSSGGQNPSIGLTAPTAAGQFIRSSGVGAWAVSGLSAGDIPTGSGNYIQNGTDAQSANFNITGNGSFGGVISRNDHAAGFLEGSYNNVGANSTFTNPIYTIGSAYNPTSSSLSNMYGVGYSHGNFWGSANGRPTGWGLYVAANGVIRAIIDGDNGIMWALGSVRSPIFYDSDNTGYYVDPASTTNLNNLRFNTSDCINGTCPPAGAIRMTPNFHLNSGAGYAVILNWDNGTTSGQTLRIGNGAGTDMFNVYANGDVTIQSKLALRGNDSWLRLNQDGGFSSGTYTPGFLRVDGGLASGGINNPGAGMMRAQNLAAAKTFVSTSDYQFVQGPGTGVDNQWHSVNCSQGYGMMTFSVYASDRWDGDLRINCANLTNILTGSWVWYDSNWGGSDVDNQYYVLECPQNYLASGFQIYAGTKLNYYPQLLCAPLTGGYSVVNYPGFQTANTTAYYEGSDNIVHSATCPTGTFVSGLTYYTSNFADGNLRLRCTGINFP